MTQRDDVDAFRPPVQPLALPLQVLERRQPALQTWLATLLRFALRRAPHE